MLVRPHVSNSATLRAPVRPRSQRQCFDRLYRQLRRPLSQSVLRAVLAHDASVLRQAQQALPSQRFGLVPVIDDVAFTIADTDPTGILRYGSNRLQGAQPMIGFAISTVTALHPTFP